MLQKTENKEALKHQKVVCMTQYYLTATSKNVILESKVLQIQGNLPLIY